MKIYDEVMEKFGDLAIDLGKTAVIAGIAALFVERFNFAGSIGSILAGLAAVFVGLYSFHVRGRRREMAEQYAKWASSSKE